jgi:hypothetical protein
MPPKTDNWLQRADRAMAKAGTEGTFTAKAKRAGRPTQKFAADVVRRLKGKKKTPAQLKLFRQALFAQNVTR